MAGAGYDFEVRPQILAGYADAMDAASRDLAAVREALASARTQAQRDWFGKLPQSGLLADRYAAHREAALAGAAALSAWLKIAAEGLRGSAERYAGADRVVAELAETVDAGLGVGIDTRIADSAEPADSGGPAG